MAFAISVAIRCDGCGAFHAGAAYGRDFAMFVDRTEPVAQIAAVDVDQIRLLAGLEAASRIGFRLTVPPLSSTA
ncbi:MAG: hypothetical protein WC729_08560 [Sphingomonas sp.]|jgi:hypothetical protein|uniref:hypothetical protein n=1 Tax=Sphingomonas sp. TaxID=28214 RepID=UPI0035640991